MRVTAYSDSSSWRAGDDLAVRRRTSGARSRGRARPARTSVPSWWSPISNRVTTPKLPPPPQTAQNRSGCSSADDSDQFAHRPGGCPSRPRCPSEAPSPAQPAEPATDREPRHARPADDAGGSREAVDLGRGIEVGPDRARLDADLAPLGVDHEAAHRREIDDDPTLAQRRSRHVVAAAADRHRQPAAPRRARRDGGVVGVDAAGDQGRAAVDRAVPQPARVVVPGPIRIDQDALERRELIQVPPRPAAWARRSKHNPNLGGPAVRLPREGGARGRGPGATRGADGRTRARRRSCGSWVRSR